MLILTALPTKANARQSALLGLAQDLHCANSEQQASEVLKKLSESPPKPFGIPDENLTGGQNVELYAATVDILLQVLYQTIQQYPRLQEKAERIALLWNYCEIINDGDLADLHFSNQNEVIKSEAIGPFPANKQGFGIWGLLGHRFKNRYSPELLKSSNLYSRELQDLIHRLQNQCFSHPDFNVWPSKSDNPSYTGALHLSEVMEPGKKYPFSWQQHCNPQPVLPPKKEIEPIKKKVTHWVQDKPIRPVNKPYVKPEPPVVESIINTPVVALENQLIDVKPRQEKPKPRLKPKLKQKKSAWSDEIEKIVLEIPLKKYKLPIEGEEPVISPSIPSGNSNAGPPLPLPPEDGLGIAGNFYHRAKLTGQMSVGTNASWKPLSYYFVRGGINYTYLPNSGKFSYSWGLGYDDHHPGTFSAQLNNWGPIYPGDDPLKGAVASFGYKFVADFLKPYHLSGSAAINVPLAGGASISTTWMWSPIEHWFVRASLSKSLVSAGGLDWSYSFGYSDWHPFTFSLTYDNWGSNPIFDSSQGNSFNFTENGAVTLAWSWAF
ncbi:MAG: hypothetical protein ABL933_10555 [Methyloglobulus sp.]|nr:hypothetical protein [Methyloglobulus sp.]